MSCINFQDLYQVKAVSLGSKTAASLTDVSMFTYQTAASFILAWKHESAIMCEISNFLCYFKRIHISVLFMWLPDQQKSLFFVAYCKIP